MIALLRGEVGGEIVRQIVLDELNDCCAHAVNICEVYYDFHRAGGTATAEAAIGAVLASGIRVQNDLDPAFWKAAGILKAQRRRISPADCFAVTLAGRLGGTLVTVDRHELEPLSAEINLLFIR